MAQDNVTSIQKSTGAISHRRINLIRAICDENENAVRLLSRIGKDQQAFIISRWKMGRSIDELLDGERGQYGENAVEAIADHTGMHPNTIYECRRFYTTTPDGPERWMESVIAANGIVLWKNVRLLIAQKTDVETLGAQGALERRIYSVDKRIERLEQDMSEIARDARSNGIAPDLKEKVLGVADRVVDVRINGFVGFSKQLTPRDDQHLEFVRQLPCAFCHANPPSEPHHVETSGTAIKGSDYSCVPVCRECHNDIHNLGNWSFQTKVNLLFAEAIAATLHERLTGEQIKLPKRPPLS